MSDNLLQQLADLKDKTLDEIAKVKTLAKVDRLFFDVLGRKGSLADLIAKIPSVSAEEKPKVGQLGNQVKQALTSAFEAKKIELGSSDEQTEGIDVTLPGVKLPVGHLHPVTQAIDEIDAFLNSLGSK